MRREINISFSAKNSRLWGLLALLLLLGNSLSLVSCFNHSSNLLSDGDSSEASTDKEGSEGDDGESATSPSNVTGHYLVCQDIDRSFLDATIGCNVHESSSKSRIDVKQDVKAIKWYSTTENNSTLSFFSDKSNRYHGIFKFRRDAVSMIEQPVVFADITTLDGRRETLKSQIDQWRIALSGHRHVRLILTSIHFVQGAETAGKPISLSEYNLNDEWVPVKVEGMTMSIGKYPVKIDASVWDLDMLFKLVNGTPITNLDGISAFSNTPPYDVKGKPITMSVDFGTDRIKIGGFRVNGGATIPLSQLPNGSFDKYHMETSDDGTNWTPVKESYMDFEKTPEILEGEWGTIDWSQIP